MIDGIAFSNAGQSVRNATRRSELRIFVEALDATVDGARRLVRGE